MKTFNLLMAIMMALATTAIIVLFIFTTEESNLGWGIITMMSLLGYLTSALYFHNYKEYKKKSASLQ
jgi:drug/metabolite transporter (DMT)-like permease